MVKPINLLNDVFKFIGIQLAEKTNANSRYFGSGYKESFTNPMKQNGIRDCVLMFNWPNDS